MTADQFNISEKALILLFSFTLAALAIDRRRMDGDADSIAGFVLEKFAPVFRNPHDFAQHRLSRGRAQADDRIWTNDGRYRAARLLRSAVSRTPDRLAQWAQQ